MTKKGKVLHHEQKHHQYCCFKTKTILCELLRKVGRTLSCKRPRHEQKQNGWRSKIINALVSYCLVRLIISKSYWSVAKVTGKSCLIIKIKKKTSQVSFQQRKASLGCWGCAATVHSSNLCAPFLRDARHQIFCTVYIGTVIWLL